jgi:23S rRNA (cytidine1920-2'-O)/16S rRNA (cytidine1409-2'-O)-methyltransferase
VSPSSGKPSSKQRADALLVARGLAETRAKAQALILAGKVWSGEQRIDKPGTGLREDTPLWVTEPDQYVSRGGHKMAGALDALAIEVNDRCCVDVGASTGGFTDCLLQRGARKVYAVDVGHGLLAARLSNDERVVVRDGTNARHLSPSDFAEPIDLLVADASFIGVDKMLPAFAAVLATGAFLLVMIKPQFEVGKEQARKNRGVIRDPVERAVAIDAAVDAVERGGFELLGRVDSTLKGPKGNLEHFAYARRR